MIECEKCAGSGKIKFYDGIGTPHYATCDLCNGTGSYLKTNEIWFCGLSTEDKADKLTDFAWWLYPEIPSVEQRNKIKEKILQWLEEEHSESLEASICKDCKNKHLACGIQPRTVKGCSSYEKEKPLAK